MRVYVRITTPDRSFCVGQGSPADELRYAAPVVTLSDIRADARTGTDPDGFEVTLSRLGGVEVMLESPPVGDSELEVIATDTNVVIATGAITRGTIDADQISLSVRLAAMTDLFPSRLSSVWGGFRTVAPIPIRYGDVRGACVEYQTADRDQVPLRKWVWSDGACAGIDEVYVDGQRRYGGWEARNRVDVTGQPVMMIEFVQPVPAGSVVSARGRGRVSGGLMIRNPGAVIADLLALAGIANPGLDFFGFECEQLGIELSGEVPAGATVQGVLRSICQSVGAIYSPRLRAVAAIYPGGTPELVGASPLIRAELDASNLGQSAFDVSDVVNAVTVSYAMRDGRPSKTMDLDAPASVLAYGRRPTEISAEWIADDGIMANIATRYLQHQARPAHVIQFAGVRADLRPGDWVHVDGTASHLPYATGNHQLVSTGYSVEDELSSGEFELRAGSAPTVRIVGQATITEDAQAIQHSVQTVGNERQVTLTNPDGSPMGNVKCVLDGRLTRFSDGAGVVTFPLADTPPGRHTLQVTLTATGQTSPGGSSGPPPAAAFAKSASIASAPQVFGPGESFGIPVVFTIEVFFA